MNYIVISADTKRHLAQPNVVEYVKKVSSSKYGIDTTKRPKSDTVGSFRKLAVDWRHGYDDVMTMMTSWLWWRNGDDDVMTMVTSGYDDVTAMMTSWLWLCHEYDDFTAIMTSRLCWRHGYDDVMAMMMSRLLWRHGHGDVTAMMTSLCLRPQEIATHKSGVVWVGAVGLTWIQLTKLRRFALAYFHSHGDATGVFSQCIPGNCRIDAFRQPCYTHCILSRWRRSRLNGTLITIDREQGMLDIVMHNVILFVLVYPPLSACERRSCRSRLSDWLHTGSIQFDKSGRKRQWRRYANGKTLEQNASIESICVSCCSPYRTVAVNSFNNGVLFINKIFRS